MLLASRVFVGGRSLRCCSSSFHSALKRQLKAEKKAKEKEAKQQKEEVPTKVRNFIKVVVII